MKGLKTELKKSLDLNDYAKFIEIITKLDINEENYTNYLYMIKEILKERFVKESPFEITSKDKLEELLGIREKEKTFIEWLPQLNNAIVIIFERKLNIKENTKYEDSDVKKDLDNFKERFM